MSVPDCYSKPRRRAENCNSLNQRYRTISGRCNNRANPEWGTPGKTFLPFEEFLTLPWLNYILYARTIVVKSCCSPLLVQFWQWSGIVRCFTNMNHDYHFRCHLMYFSTSLVNWTVTCETRICMLLTVLHKYYFVLNGVTLLGIVEV